ncbi:NirD/YgiW/YdeI family stress tolerance protein [Nitratidesulfovibrio termitidis]|uniref:NirD/YgiW/YdeI family stress tolerance protein n=1 Tax=Nitratidesulfovibrio termitidis TaxID=42252 RepID=UPI0018DB9DCF|nr:NirD/YgiW/YdeI family stress tolerance protein [Nitratidesulfovibrio termitidis]
MPTKMRLCIFAVLLLLAAPWLPRTFAATSQGGFHSAPLSGGFSGPGVSFRTVQQAHGMRDDYPVVLRGSIIQHLGKDKYLFKDTTESISVEIDQDKWAGQNVAPGDTVELYGEIDEDCGCGAVGQSAVGSTWSDASRF